MAKGSEPPAAIHGFSVMPLGQWAWWILGVLILFGDKLIWFGTERVWGRYDSEH